MWGEQKGDDIIIRLHIQPRGSKDEITGIHGDALKIRVTSPPVDGAANSHIIELISKKLHIARSRIELVQGDRSRHKTIRVSGIKLQEAETLLGIRD